MKSSVYYNDSEPFVCDWLENLIREKLLPDGVVDRRPIQEVEPKDVRSFTQCHFFAGIGGWAYALRLADWPDDRAVWTGSCPCQPFSAAGKGQAEDDPRHLWPYWFRLIRECRPLRVFGEQVANAIGHGWFDVVATDLEAEAYTVGAVVLGAHSVGAPHIRQRLWFVADRNGTRCGTGRTGEAGNGRDAPRVESSGLRIAGAGAVENTTAVGGGKPPAPGCTCGHTYFDYEGNERWAYCLIHDGSMADALPAGRPKGRAGTGSGSVASGGESRELADAECGTAERRGHDVGAASRIVESEARERQRIWSDPWAGCEFIPCRDGKARPVIPRAELVAHGLSPELAVLCPTGTFPQRSAILRGAGNAINPYTAAAFVRAYMEAR